MSRYAIYPGANPQPAMRRWLVLALLLSLGLHAGFFTFAYWKTIENFAFTPAEKLAPPQFVVQQVYIDPKAFEPPEEARITLPDAQPKATDLTVPLDKPELKEIVLKPSLNEIQSPLLDGKPDAKPINLEAIMKTDAISAGSAEKDAGAIASALLQDSVPQPRQPVINLPAGTRHGSGADAWEGIPGRTSLDDALSRTGPLPAGGVPIAMPGGALFDYDKAQLRPDALDELQKLAQLIQRNPAATFRIEGHTDAIGSREYNLELSLRRAEAVKAWLIEALEIDSRRIETVGFGPDKLIVPGDRSIDEQQPNRRVEIVIKTNRR
jgi:outer membrane protein OmpA-like peptidoglycan-associated protein